MGNGSHAIGKHSLPWTVRSNGLVIGIHKQYRHKYSALEFHLHRSPSQQRKVQTASPL